jgi:hypothetical protein
MENILIEHTLKITGYEYTEYYLKSDTEGTLHSVPN